MFLYQKNILKFVQEVNFFFIAELKINLHTFSANYLNFDR